MIRGESALTVGKAFDVLAVLAASSGPLPVAEIARRTGASPTSTYRLLSAMESRGATRRLPSGRHELGGLLRLLGSRVDFAAELRIAAAGIMCDVREACDDETVGLYVRLNSAEMTCVEVMTGRHPIQHVESLAEPIVICGGATSAVFLAEMLGKHDVELVTSYLSGLPASVRTRPVSDLVAQAERTKRRGYAETRFERIPGAAALATAVTDAAGDELVAVLTLSGPADRFTAPARTKWMPVLRTGARAISARLRA